jgi:hypothetical protein
MEPESVSSDTVVAFSRCRHIYVNGRRCRLLPPDQDSAFCIRHAKLPENQINPDNTANLTAGLTEFTSAEPVNDFLSRLLLLLGQNRISPKRAAVLAYIASQILRTIAAIERREGPKNRLQELIESMPPTPDELEFMASEQAHIEAGRAYAAANVRRTV